MRQLSLKFTDVHRQFFTSFAAFFYIWICIPVKSFALPMYLYFVLQTLQKNSTPFEKLSSQANGAINLTLFLSGIALLIGGLVKSTPKSLIYIFSAILWLSLTFPYYWNEFTTIYSVLTMLPFVIVSSLSLYTTYKLKN